MLDLAALQSQVVPLHRNDSEHAVTAGVDAKLELWMGMLHGFVTNVGGFSAATQELNTIRAFLTERPGRTGR